MLYWYGVGVLMFYFVEWIEIVCMQGQFWYDDLYFMVELLLSMIVGQDFDKQCFYIFYCDDVVLCWCWVEFFVDSFLCVFVFQLLLVLFIN